MMLAFLSRLDGTRVATLMVQALGANTTIVMAPIMDEASGSNTFPYPISGFMIIGTKDELLTKFLLMKPPSLQGTKFEDIFEFIIYYYKWLHKMGIMQQHGVKFVTILLEKNLK